MKGFFIYSALRTSWTIGLVLLTCKGLAQERDSSLLREVVVTATRRGTDKFLTPYTVSMLSSPERAMQLARTTPEALLYTPGVFVQKTNHGGGAPFLRGLTGNQTLLMIDGIRFNNATFRYGPNQYANLIDPFTIQRMEVVKGSGSVQYGSDAMGGVIQVFTKDHDFRPLPGWFGSATGRIVSEGMEKTLRAEAGLATSRFVLEGGYTMRDFGDLHGGDTTGQQKPSGYRERDWNLKLKVKLHKHILFTASSQQVTQRDVPLYHRVKLEDFDYYRFDPQKMNVSYGRFQINTNHSFIKEFTLTGIYKRSSESRAYHKNGNSSYFSEQDDVKTGGVTLDVVSTFTNSWTANTGLEFYNDRVKSTRVNRKNTTEVQERGLYPDNALQRNFSLYSMHHWAFAKWQLEGGLRYNLFTNLLPSSLLSMPGVSYTRDVKVKPSSLVGNASVLYRLQKQHAFYFSFSSGYRAPGIEDMGTLGLVDFRYEVPAYDLKPEKNYHAEIGYRYNTGSVYLEAAVFYMRLTNLISRIATRDSMQGFPVYTKVNDQRAFIQGVEVSGSWDIDQHWRIKSFAAYQYGQNISRNEPVRRIPPANGLTNLTYQRKKWYLSAEYQWGAKQSRLAKGDQEDNRIPKGGTPGWNLLHLYAGYQWAHCHIKLSGSNLLNTDYRMHGSGINGMGRALTVSVIVMK